MLDTKKIAIRKMLTLLAVAAMLITIFAVCAACRNEPEEQVTTVSTEEELSTALANGGTISLGADVSVSDTLTIAEGTTATLCLNGHKLSGEETIFSVRGALTLKCDGKITADKRICQAEGGTVTVKNGTFDSTADCAFWTDNGGTLIFDGGTISAQEFCVGASRNSTVTINDGSFSSRDNAVLGTNGTENLGGNTITVNGGTFDGKIQTSGYIACGFYIANDDTLNFNGGTLNITNGTGILIRGGKVTIGKNIVINSQKEENGVASGKVGDSSVNIEAGTAIVVDYKSDYPGMTEEFSLTNNSDYAVVELKNNQD